jgi:signal transduction histidine kinase
MSDALALIAHDLKNALGGLESELAHLIDEPSPVLAQRAHIHCSDLRRQFIQFLTLYGAENGNLKAMCEDEAPEELLLSLARVWHVKMQAEERPIKVELRPQEASPPFWHFDRRLVQLALDAAIHNAVRFAMHQVTVQVLEEDGWLVWRVCDDGEGLGSTDPGRQHATGLGTALAQAVAHAHRLKDRVGHTTLTSAPGRGTCFALYLP